ncbi:hypothetical protein [Microbacterium lacus]|uniref:hypothetical protein n=1 Tax=Microbacterium lacus TaxID=415217 RepID=UPI0031D4E977
MSTVWAGRGAPDDGDVHDDGHIARAASVILHISAISHVERGWRREGMPGERIR